MFGYVTPYKNQLKVIEYDVYRSVYCGLCKTIGQKYGGFPRMFLSYDFVFLALLLQNTQEEKPQICPGRCMLHPTKKRLICKENSGLEYVSGLSVILLYHKMQDNIDDGLFFTRTKYFFAKQLLKGAYKKAKKEYPKTDEAVANSIAALRIVEEEKSDNLDLAASTFADMMESIVKEGTKDEIDKRVLGEIGKNIGRWIYIMDAYSDIEEDLEQKSYNPLFYRYEYNKSETPMLFRERIKDKIDFTLVQSLSAILTAYELLPQGEFSSILENIICLGLSAKQKEIIFIEGEEENGSI